MSRFKRSIFQGLMLVGFLLWTSGAGGLLHLRLAHGAGASGSLLVRAASREPDKRPTPYERGAHDDCAVCHALHGMGSDGLPPISVVPSLETSFIALVALSPRPMLGVTVLCKSSRGPPEHSSFSTPFN